jgi:hypothetical protein
MQPIREAAFVVDSETRQAFGRTVQDQPGLQTEDSRPKLAVKQIAESAGGRGE